MNLGDTPKPPPEGVKPPLDSPRRRFPNSFGGGSSLWLPLDQPLDLESSLESGQVFRWRRRGGWWEGVLGRELVWLRQGPGRLEYRTGREPPESLAPELLRYFRLDDDLPAIQRSLSWDPRVAEAVQQHPGLRLLRQEPWECLVSFICSQNSNIPRITGIIEGLCGAFGAPVQMGRWRRWGFPSAEALAHAGAEALERLGLGYRAGYVARTAEVIASGGLALEALREAPYEEAKGALLELPGVGEKVADCVLLFSLEKLEAFPVDVWVRGALREYPEARKVKDAKLASWARERFGPRAGYAQQYLFHRRRRKRRRG